MSHIVSKPDSGERIIDERGVATERFQLFLDDIEIHLNHPLLPEFTVQDLTVTVPPAIKPKVPASARKYGMVIVTNEVDGEVPAWSDGTNWRRVTDRAIIS